MKIKLIKFKSVTSTNDIAIKLIKKKKTQPTLITSTRQTKGRGTMGKKWVSINYADTVDKITTIVLKQDDWIIGHISMRVIEDNAHLFHLFITPSNRKCGLATKLVNTIENQGKIFGCKTFSINVIPKNNFAKKLYEKLGYKETQQSKSKWISSPMTFSNG